MLAPVKSGALVYDKHITMQIHINSMPISDQKVLVKPIESRGSG